MKAVILAGGLGTRLAEETSTRPKPMVEIGGRPILWHIMKIYSSYGVNDFIICCGYKSYVIKEYFVNYALHDSDVTVDVAANKIELQDQRSEPWRVTLVDTGADTMTGGRLKRVKKYLELERDFCFTYGDGVADVNIGRVIEQHRNSGKVVTLTAAAPPGRFGALSIKNNVVHSFHEKPSGDGAVVNAGFFVCSSAAIDYIADDSTTWEKEPLEKLAHEGNLGAYVHNGFWQPMDTLRDKIYLENMWLSGCAPWKTW